MSKLLGLLSERRRRRTGGDVVRFVHWADFDKDALCVAAIGNAMVEQKQHESFKDFTDRAAAVAGAQEYLFIWINNLNIEDGVIQRPSHSVGQLLNWQ